MTNLVAAIEIGDSLRIDTSIGLADLTQAAATMQRRLLTWSVTTTEDAVTVLDDLRRIRATLGDVEAVVRDAHRKLLDVS